MRQLHALARLHPAPLSTSNIPRIKVWACFQVLSDKRAASRVPFLVRVRERAPRCLLALPCLLACCTTLLSLSLYLSAKKVYPKDFERRERESVWHVWMQHSSRKSAARRLLLQQIAMHAGGNGLMGRLACRA